MSELLLTDARLIDPSRNLDAVAPLAIRDGRFVTPADLRNPTVLSLPGKVVAPGFIDVHVHLRDPGQTHKEDMASGTAAARAGGFTTVLAMPNTAPAIDTPERVQAVMENARQHACINVLQAGAITFGRQGEKPTDIHALHLAGCPAVSDDGSTPQNEDLMRAIMTAAAAEGIPVIDHCENTALSKPGLLHQGTVSQLLNLPGQPREAEISIVRRDLRLAAETGCHIHLQHLSCRESLDLLQEARRNGVRATAELTPHHLLLTHLDCLRYGVNAKMAPPLREEEDRLALLEAIRTGLVTIIATDHAPHTAAEKAQGWTKAPFGITGIESVVPLCLTHLVHSGLITLPQMIALFTEGPRRLLNSDRGTLQPGAPADVTILDPQAEGVIDPQDLHSKSLNCPWLGWKFHGKVVGTIVA